MLHSPLARRRFVGALCMVACFAASAARAAEAGKPLEVLYITGGCCHDYEGQKKVITQGLAAHLEKRKPKFDPYSPI